MFRINGTQFVVCCVSSLYLPLTYRLTNRFRAIIQLIPVFQEYEGASTAEAKFVKDFDKFDMELQAYEYETDQPKIRERRLQEFFDSTNGEIAFSYNVCELNNGSSTRDMCRDIQN